MISKNGVLKWRRKKGQREKKKNGAAESNRATRESARQSGSATRKKRGNEKIRNNERISKRVIVTSYHQDNSFYREVPRAIERWRKINN